MMALALAVATQVGGLPPHKAVGLLVAVAPVPAVDAYLGGTFTTEPQRLETWWVEPNTTGTATLMSIPGLLIPGSDGFTRYVMQRVSERTDAAGHEYWFDRLASWPHQVAEPPPSAQWARQPRSERQDEPLPCSWSVGSVLFASPTLLSLQEVGGSSEACEPRGWSGSIRSWVRPLDSDTRLGLSEVAGGRATQAYARAAVLAHRIWWNDGQVEADNPEACQPNADDDTGWYIARQGTGWRPFLQQQPGPSFCEMGAPVEIALPSSAIGFKEPSIRWSAVLKAYPTAKDAFASPDGRILLVNQGGRLVVGDQAGSILADLPLGNVVLVQWAEGAKVALWREALSRRWGAARRPTRR